LHKNLNKEVAKKAIETAQTLTTVGLTCNEADSLILGQRSLSHSSMYL